MGTKTKVSAAILTTAAVVYLVTRPPQAESPWMVTIKPPTADAELQERIDAELVSAAKEAGGRSQVAEEAPVDVATIIGTNALRVVLEGITEEDARMAAVRLTARDENEKTIAGIEDSWPCDGLTTDSDLDPFLARVAMRIGDLRAIELEVEVDHPHHLSETARVSLARDVEPTNGKTIYEVRVPLVGPEFWPEFTLAVRDAHTRAHLEDVELRFLPGMSTSMWGRNNLTTSFEDSLRAPIALMGGRDADDPEASVAHLAVRPAVDESPRLVKLAYATRLRFGFHVSARAPGYSWGSIALDFSESDERELLLTPGSAIDVRLENVQLERYRALETKPMLCVSWIREDGGDQWVHFAPLDEALETEGLRLEGLEPGGYRVTVELGGGEWAKRPVLARDELTLAAGETRALVLSLTDPPAPPERVTLGGVVSFPAFDGMEDVRLQLYPPNWDYGVANVELVLADMVRVGGELPTWSFWLEDIPVGTCQIRLLPFQKSWMIDVPVGGREDVELVIAELAELRVETVDARTGERIPLEKIRYGSREELEGQVYFDWSTPDHAVVGFEGEPGLFRVWMAPGATYVRTWNIPSEQGYASTGKELELVPGLQSVRLELTPPCRIHYQISVDGAAPQLSDGIWEWVHYGTLQCVNAVDHEGRSKGRVGEQLTEVSAPGIYEISFEDLTEGRFLPILSQRVDVRAGETAEVIVELRRK